MSFTKCCSNSFTNCAKLGVSHLTNGCVCVNETRGMDDSSCAAFAVDVCYTAWAVCMRMYCNLSWDDQGLRPYIGK